MWCVVLCMSFFAWGKATSSKQRWCYGDAWCCSWSPLGALWDYGEMLSCPVYSMHPGVAIYVCGDLVLGHRSTGRCARRGSNVSHAYTRLHVVLIFGVHKLVFPPNSLLEFAFQLAICLYLSTVFVFSSEQLIQVSRWLIIRFTHFLSSLDMCHSLSSSVTAFNTIAA